MTLPLQFQSFSDRPKWLRICSGKDVRCSNSKGDCKDLCKMHPEESRVSKDVVWKSVSNTVCLVSTYYVLIAANAWLYAMAFYQYLSWKQVPYGPKKTPYGLIIIKGGTKGIYKLEFSLCVVAVKFRSKPEPWNTIFTIIISHLPCRYLLLNIM